MSLRVRLPPRPARARRGIPDPQQLITQFITETRKVRLETRKLKPKTRNPTPETRNPEIRNPKLATPSSAGAPRFPKPDNRDPTTETQIPKPDTQITKPETRNPEILNPKPEILKLEALKPEVETLNPEP